MSDVSRMPPWVRLCELAMCSPDFDVVHRMNRDEACRWLHERLASYDYDEPIPDIERAYDSWRLGG